MGILRKRQAPEAPRLVYRRCPGCDYDFATGDGVPWCGEPPGCRWATEGYRHAENARRFQAGQR